MAGSGLSVLDLITEALALMGEYSPGEPLDAAAVQSLLFTLNGALDGLGGEPLAIYSNAVLTFATIAGKQAYTLGPTPADWVTAAAVPSLINGVSMLANGALELPIDSVSADEWAGYGLKSMQSSISSAVWIQYGPASHVLNFWPVPSVAFSVKLYTSQQVPQFVTSADSVVLPTGYQEFLTYDLVIKSAAKFGAAIPEWVPTAWRDARTRIKERNFRALESRCDPALTQQGRRGGWPSIRFYTGD
jgi:hypothetical protein